MSSIDDLIRNNLAVPEDDSAEAAGLAAARARLDAATGTERNADRQGMRSWTRRLSTGVRLVPAAAVCALVAVIAVGAVLLVHGRSTRKPVTMSRPPSSAALISQLAVLRRPPTAADRLPAQVADHWSRLSEETQAGSFVPNLTRLVFANDQVKIYLAVVKPMPGPYHLWTSQAGDEVTLVAIKSHTVDATQAIPAEALADASIVSLVGAGSVPVSAVHGLYLVSIVPDGISRARWTYAHTTPEVDVTVHNNVAVTPCKTTAMAAYSRLTGTWYAATGQPVRTNDSLIKQAVVAEQDRRYRQTLRAVRAEHTSASPQILRAFAVFSFNSPTGTRIADGLVISRPPLDQIPLGVLGLGERLSGRASSIDFREARRVQAPSGLSMFILPGRSGLCVLSTGVFEIGEAPSQAAGAAEGCDLTLQNALLHGAGLISLGGSSQIDYRVLPEAHPTATITIRGGRQRRIHPEDGVYIKRS